MKKISIISDTRLPTENQGNHGLGRVAWDVANGFRKLGYGVTLYAGYDTVPPLGVDLIQRASEIDFSEIVPRNVPAIDFSHFHDFSSTYPNAPVLNYISDGEVKYNPPNACVCVKGDLKKHPSAEIVPLGIDIDAIPFYDAKRKGKHIAFMAKIIPEKGVDLALSLQKMIKQKIFFAGRRYYNVDLGVSYMGELRGNIANTFLGSALALLQFTRFGNGGGRVSLEAAACGTPTLCLSDNAAKEHVFDCVSGYVCDDLISVAAHIELLNYLDGKTMRQWVGDSHNIQSMVYRFKQLIENL